MQRLEKAMDEQGIILHRNLRVSQVVYCLWKEIDPLSKDESYTRMLTPNLWQEIQDYPYSKEEMLGALKYGNKDYTGIETEKGILLFGTDLEGRRQSEYCLQQIANHFFDSDFKGQTLAVHELKGWPSVMDGKINLCRHEDWEMYKLDEIPESAYFKKSDVKSIMETETYNLAPTWENYYQLTNKEDGLNLLSTVENYDIQALLFLKDKGYPEDGLLDEYPNQFSFYNDFEEIEKELAGRTIYDPKEDVLIKAQNLAGKLLDKHFPHIRQEQPAQEVKHVASITNVARDKSIKM